jgi:hypothetical protein
MSVAEIEHVHHAEDEREAGGHGEDHHAHRQVSRGQLTKVENEPMNGAAAGATTSGVNAGRISALRRGGA